MVRFLVGEVPLYIGAPESTEAEVETGGVKGGGAHRDLAEERAERMGWRSARGNRSSVSTDTPVGCVPSVHGYVPSVEYSPSVEDMYRPFNKYIPSYYGVYCLSIDVWRRRRRGWAGGALVRQHRHPCRVYSVEVL